MEEPAAAWTELLVGIAAWAGAWRIGRVMVELAQREEYGNLQSGSRAYDIFVSVFWLPAWWVALVAFFGAAFFGALEHALPLTRIRLRIAAARVITLLLAITSAGLWAAMLIALSAGLVRDAGLWVNDSPGLDIPSHPIFPFLFFVAAVKLLLMVANALRRPIPSFGATVFDLLVSLLALVYVASFSFNPGGGLTAEAGPALAWLAGGVAVAVTAGAVQRLRIAPHPKVDHNAAFHLLLLPALWMLLEGALQAVGHGLLG